MRRILLVLLLISGACRLPAADEPSPAQRELQAIVTRQQKLMAEAVEKDGTASFDPDKFRLQMQEIAYDYDAYIAKYPNTAAGYAAYGYFLGKLEPAPRYMVSMLLKANQLDPNLPLVKNQLGKYLAEQGQPVEALNYFLSAVDLDPTEPLYHYQVGSVLSAGRDVFLESGQWTRAQLDQALLEAFRKAAELAPRRVELAYRYAMAFYEVENPDWEAALKQWELLEAKAEPGVALQSIHLQRANVLCKQGKFDSARILLATVSEPALAEQKEKLVAQLPAEPAK